MPVADADVCFSAHSGLKSDIASCPKSAISGSHSILVATGEHLAAMVIRAARLAAILLPNRMPRPPKASAEMMASVLPELGPFHI